jgi:hypothetical protein
MTSLSFDDKTAGNIATVALRKTAEMQKDDLPNVSGTIDNIATARETTCQIDDLVMVGGSPYQALDLFITECERWQLQ